MNNRNYYPSPCCHDMDDRYSQNPKASLHEDSDKIDLAKDKSENFVSKQILEDYTWSNSRLNPCGRDPMMYGKTSGMLLAKRYYPQFFPFYDFSLIKTIQEWEAVRERYGAQMIHRVDYPLSAARRNVIWRVLNFSGV